MRFFFLTGFAALALVGVVAIGCNEESTNAANGTSSGSSGGDDGGSSSGSSSGASSGGGTFWFISRKPQHVGVSDLSGADIWSELVEEGELSALTIGAGSAWVLTKEGNLRRYDLTTHELVKTIASVAKNPRYMTFTAGSVWLTDDNDGSACKDVENGPTKLLRVDPASNEVVARIPVTATSDFPCNRFDGLGTDGTLLYPLINNNFGITAVDPATNKVTKRAALGAGGGYGAGYLAVGSGALWVHDTNAKTLIAVDPSTLAVKTTTPLSADYLGEQMVASATAIVMDKPGTTVLRVDAADPTKQEEMTFADAPDAFILHDGALYATVRHDLSANLLTLDPSTLAESKRVELPLFSGVDELVFVP
jgi:hypothetical protein